MTPEQARLREAFMSLAPTGNASVVLRLWDAALEAWEGNPPSEIAYQAQMLMLDWREAEKLTTTAVEYRAARGIAARLRGEPLV